MELNKKLIFLHIPKTAGSTFHMILNKRYKSNDIRNLFGSRYDEPEIKSFMEEPIEEKQNIRLLKGHMPFGMHNYLPKESRYISVLRNPVERVISQYYYIKKNSYNPLHNQVEKDGMTISEFVSSGISVGMNNGHCRFLNGDLDEYKFNQCDEVLLEQVKENIKRHFIWLGLTERFDESVLVLSKLLGWKSPPYYIRENVSKNRKSRDLISKEEISVIEKYNSLDMKLYSFVNDMLDKQIKDISNFSGIYEAYKNKNRTIQKRWGWLPDRYKHFVI